MGKARLFIFGMILLFGFMGVVSAGWSSDFWNNITGKVTNIEEDCTTIPFRDADGDGCHAGLDSDCGGIEGVGDSSITCFDGIDNDCDGMIDFEDDDLSCSNTCGDNICGWYENIESSDYYCPEDCVEIENGYEYSIEIDEFPFITDEGEIIISIFCREKGMTYSYGCEDKPESKISRVYIYIKDSSGMKVQDFNLTQGGERFPFSGNIDYDSLIEEIYILSISVEGMDGTKEEIFDYYIFSGQGWNTCFEDSECSEHHSCVNNKCVLNEVNYKLGLVYIYDDEENYNPNWRNEFEIINDKVEESLLDISNNKINITIEIIGEMRTNVYCWNPATVGGIIRNNIVEVESFFRMPGSTFTQTGIGVNEGQEIVESYCDNCILRGDIYEIDCDNSLTYDNLFETNKLEQLDQQISEELEFDINDYDGIFIIFGKLGQILPEENEQNLEYRCNTLGGIIGGYSNLIMAENSIKSGGLIQCDNIGRLPFYDKMGWHMMTHEILHRFGAEDIYETGTTFGIKTHRERALEIDSLADESIMGNGDRDCIDEGGYEKDGNICTIEELERTYLDKYNRQKIGIESGETYRRERQGTNTLELKKGCASNECLVEDVCYPLGYRKSGEYCSDSLEFVRQLPEDLTCENNFECKSNLCLSGQCVDSNLLQKIIGWFKNFFS